MSHEKLLTRIENKRDDLVELTCDLVKIPTINPPGEYYTDCAQFLGDRLANTLQVGHVALSVGQLAELTLLTRATGDAAADSGPALTGVVDLCAGGHGFAAIAVGPAVTAAHRVPDVGTARGYGDTLARSVGDVTAAVGEQTEFVAVA